MMYREALRAALQEEMERDATVFCVGGGIAERGGPYKVTEGPLAPFGPGPVLAPRMPPRPPALCRVP